MRVGVIGCGRVFHYYGGLLERLRHQRLAEPVAACDTDPSRADYARERLGPVSFTTDVGELLARDDIDLVLVLTAAQSHGEIVGAALEAGKHVVVEKPLAATLAEAGPLVALARARSLMLLCGPHVILSPTYQAIWKHVRQGDIGRVHLARARSGHAHTLWAPWFYRRGSNALSDLGVYNLTSLTGLLGPAQSVAAMAGIAVPEREVAGERIVVEAIDNAHLLLDFGDTLFASVMTGNTVHDYRSPAIELYGSEGVIQLLGDDWAPEGYELWQTSGRVWQILPDPAPLWHWTDGLRHAVECIRESREPLIAPEHALHVLEIMIRAEEAAADGRARPLETRFEPLRLDPEAIDLAPASGHVRALTPI